MSDTSADENDDDDFVVPTAKKGGKGAKTASAK